MADETLLSLEDAKRAHHGPLSRIVLEFLTVMDRVVNKDKQPAITKADFQPSLLEIPFGKFYDFDFWQNFF